MDTRSDNSNTTTKGAEVSSGILHKRFVLKKLIHQCENTQVFQGFYIYFNKLLEFEKEIGVNHN
jgi:hypothetical protein